MEGRQGRVSSNYLELSLAWPDPFRCYDCATRSWYYAIAEAENRVWPRETTSNLVLQDHTGARLESVVQADSPSLPLPRHSPLLVLLNSLPQ